MKAVREWVSITDPQNPKHIWKFDVSFFGSHWNCIYGNGCQSIDAHTPWHGCCSLGAYLADGEAEWFAKEIEPHLNPQYMEHYGVAQKRGYLKKRGEQDHTRTINGACIFLNSPDHEKPGCAMHHLAMDRNTNITEGKFEVCWSVPLGVKEEEQESGFVVFTVGAWSHWSWTADESEPVIEWFCTTDQAAYQGENKAYITLGPELVKLTTLDVYLELCRYMESRNSVPVTIAVRNGKAIAPNL